MEPRVVERGGTTLHIWEEPAPPSGVRWALDYKGPEYARVQPDVIVYTFSVAESFYDVTFELPNRCRGRTAYGADFTIPLIVVGTMADLRHAYEHERKLITDREARSLAEKVSALYYVEVSARERTNIDLLWDVLAKSKSMRHWIEAREFRNRRLGLSPPEGTADDVPLLPSEDRSRCVLS
ncbi:uncharacterized protein ACA1_306870 [Acanthamoeba castellanii str. Neff]|uniref:Uncharacterized protein n=1 Tax=Acanthamoeba castellanii (strain ATCC 30010 / Neff) TaxID=1257118 RepID=L8GRX8_ACACF|nr:uncharacterized protein ACA1_306870 [Acanthamoeba castellanii str. Neff]ELR14891.1 hypothetical protein ACA1_306870 [Acanthamoeba castellanii str. Neff]